MTGKQGLEALMEVVAAQWCLGHTIGGPNDGADVRDFIPASGTVTAAQFVDWVFLASTPETRRSPAPMWQRARAEIRAAFVTHMGGEEVDATALLWPFEYLPLPNPETFTRNLTEEELLDYREEFGADSREWILARNELRRRRGPSRISSLILWCVAFALLGLLWWLRSWF